jgi:pyruvate,water dikinase
MAGLLGRVRALLGRRRTKPRELTAVGFRVRYQRFRELLVLNDAALELYADIEDRLASPEPFALDATLRRIRSTALDVFVMVKNLNQIAEDRFPALYDALDRISDRLQAELEQLRGMTHGPLVVPLERVRADATASAGAKMANLGEVAAATRYPVPNGFVITTAAFGRFMSDNQLWERSERLEGLLEAGRAGALDEACAEVHRAIVAAPVPADLARAIADTVAAMPGGGSGDLALRSSAVGEDAASSSHAGIYRSQLEVPRGQVLEVYRSIVASAFTPAAVSYRFARGLTAGDSAMAVGCLEMLEPETSGIMFSRHPDRLAEDLVMITAIEGVAAGVAAGTAGGSTWVGPPDGPFEGDGELVSTDDLRRLATAARALETHFRSPQDVEWALERDGRLAILQTRPMVAAPVAAPTRPDALAGLPVIVSGGATACGGLASGVVTVVHEEAELQDFPEDAVLVARHSSPAFIQVMARCAAIVTEVGSAVGHMAILAREFGVPTVVGMPDAVLNLPAGRPVTVDATGRRVLDGVPAEGQLGRRSRRELIDSPATRALERVADHVTPLHLTDPAAPTFAPSSCRTLHDITRFVHEKAFEVMFHFGDAASADRHHSYRLEAPLPISIRVFDVGGGLFWDSYPSGRVREEDIASVPMRAFLAGMMEARVTWQRPRSVSMTGFLSVLGESMVGPPAEAQQIGRLSYAILSDRYLNFSTKAGYHFSTVDAYCGRSTNKNYIHFRFSGGAADVRRRTRRIQFLLQVLEARGFEIEVRGDILNARFDKYEQETIRERLVELGRLTLCARQLDMLMDSDASPAFFATAFLEGRLDRF